MKCIPSIRFIYFHKNKYWNLETIFNLLKYSGTINSHGSEMEISEKHLDFRKCLKECLRSNIIPVKKKHILFFSSFELRTLGEDLKYSFL